MKPVNKPDSKKFALDRLALFGGAILVVILMNLVPRLTGLNHNSMDERWWLYGALSMLVFLRTAGWPYRSKFRDWHFVLFFMLWGTAHILLYLWGAVNLGMFLYFLTLIPQLLVGCLVAIRLFGPPDKV